MSFLSWLPSFAPSSGRNASTQGDVPSVSNEEAHSSNELLRVLETLTKGIVIIDPRKDGMPITYVNKCFCAFSGRDKWEFEGKNANALLPLLSADFDSQMMDDLLQECSAKNGKSGGKCPLAFSKQTGADDPTWHEFCIESVLDSEGNTELFVGCLRDITEERLHESRMFQIQKMDALGQLAGGVAHDFNNILSIIDGYSRMAEKLMEKGSPAANYQERIRQATKRGAALTKQLLTFGRHKIIENHVTDVGAFIREQEEMLRPLIDSAINLMVSVEKKLFVECAPDGLSQIVMNLVLNARDAMPMGGTLLVDARVCDSALLPNSIRDKSKPYMILTVTDTGVGIDPSVRDRIFDPFFTTKGQGTGTGIGLSMVYGIVMQMKGQIDVHSALGYGTSMRVFLPLSDKTPVEKIVKSADNDAGVSFNGYTVLVAEDEPDLLFVVTQMLEGMGMKVLSSSNGNDALAKQDDFDGDIDFLLTDVVMPEVNGLKLAELMTEVRPNTKIVFMSGYPANGAMAQVQLPNDVSFMAKPVTAETVAQMFKQQISGVRDGAKEEMTRRWVNS
jgi:signal transduction histidine kinase/ActR/RegA family two-component response regulator